MDLAAVLRHLADVQIVRLEVFPDRILLHAVTQAATAVCPTCCRPSQRRHGA